MARYFSRMGDGSPISVTKDEIMADLIQGSEDAADRAKVPSLTQEEYEHLLDIFCAPQKWEK
jgi:dimethylamine--corrinoid protein Co-methyltransferase